jgi:protein disulfide-isomerase
MKIQTSSRLHFLVIALWINFCFLACSQGTSSTNSYTPANEGWLVDLEAAYKQSIKTKKPIMANFTGSDWCGWCKRLTASVFDKPEFKTWAAKNVILLELDYPRMKALPENIRQQNAFMMQSFPVSGYPTVWIFDAQKDKNGKFLFTQLGATGYAPSVQEFTNSCSKIISQRKI